MRPAHFGLVLMANGILALTGWQPPFELPSLAAVTRPLSESNLLDPPSLSEVSAEAAFLTRSRPGDGEEQPRVVPAPLASPGLRAGSEPPERLVIPTIGLDAKVVPIGIRLGPHGLEWQTAPFAVGYHEGSADPADTGNVVLSGHISSRSEGAIFRRLPEVKIGDGLIVATQRQMFVYRVTDIKVTTPAAVEVLERTMNPVVTLITCVPDGVYSHRLVVRGQRL